MKSDKYLSLAAAFVLLLTPAALAKSKDEHSMKLDEPVQVGSAQLPAGNYKVEWQGMGEAVPIKFLRDGKTVLSTTGQVVEKDKPAEADQVMMQETKSKHERLEEIDFGHRREALLFSAHTRGM